MIQVCSSCGTRWNVRDKQRSWCPRCQGALLPPTSEPVSASPATAGWSRSAVAASPGGPAKPGSAGAPKPGPAGQLPPGYRWIAVRPGAPPAPRPRGRHLSPTPRYDSTPRWGLPYTVEPPASGEAPHAERRQVSAAVVQPVLTTTAVVLGVAALVYLLRYVLSLVNRTVLLHPLIAYTAVALGILASLAAVAAMITCWVVLTRWLIDRRAAAYAYYGLDDPREKSSLWLGCMVPLANLFWAPVYVIETARLEGLYSRLRRDIVVWWLWWALSALASTFAVVWLFSFDWYFFGVRIALNNGAQAVADNTVAMICAYLIAAAAVLALARVYRGFAGKPVASQGHRWVVVADRATDFVAPVETQGQEPAA